MIRRALSITALGLVVSASAARADSLLDLELDYPLIVAQFGQLSYDADGAASGNGLLTATAFTTSYDLDGFGTNPMYNMGTFNLSIEIIPSTGGLVYGSPDNHVLVTGDITDDGTNNVVTLLESTKVKRFGYGTEDKFEVTFVLENGALHAPTAQMNIIMDARHIPLFNDPIEPFFTQDFTSTGLKADIFVPTPAAAWVALPALAWVVIRSRKRC